jgi:hypothetical protein
LLYNQKQIIMNPKKELKKNDEMAKAIFALVLKAVAFDAIKYSQKFPN